MSEFTHGGARKGAGRKSKGDFKHAVSVRLTPENKEWYDSQSDRAVAVNKAIEAYRDA